VSDMLKLYANLMKLVTQEDFMIQSFYCSWPTLFLSLFHKVSTYIPLDGLNGYCKSHFLYL
jgi:hypothetical protein